MANNRRHSQAEIAVKLREAAALLAEGKRQQDVARALGISVMTLHRWRKAQAEPTQRRPIAPADSAERDHGLRHEWRQRMDALQLENDRLRRLVTDLLLDKISLLDRIKPQDWSSPFATMNGGPQPAHLTFGYAYAAGAACNGSDKTSR